MLRDLRFTWRRMARMPGFSLTVVLLLGLALGANACVFSVVYGLLYKPLPFAQAERLVTIDTRFTSMNIDFNLGVSVPYLDGIAQQSRTLASVAAYRKTAAELHDDSDAAGVPWRAAYAQPALFALLGTTAAAGRLFNDEEARDGAAPVALLDWNTWQSRYAGAPDAVGRTLRLEGKNYRIVGVLPRNFALVRNDPQLWLPLTFSAASHTTQQAGSFADLFAVARLRDGSTLADADGEVAALARSLDGLKEIIEVTGFKSVVKPLRSIWTEHRESALRLMLFAVALVLLVTAANICNLYIARLLARRHEAAVFEALGASPARLLWQVCAEAMCLCAGAAAVALALLPAGLSLLESFELLPADAPQRIGADGVTVVFIAVLALSIGALMTLAGRVLLRANVHEAIKQGGSRQTAAGPAQRARQALIVGQIALTATLLVGAGLLLRSSQALLAEDVGFDRDRLLMAAVDMSGSMHADEMQPDISAATEQRKRNAVRALLERVRALPGVQTVGAGNMAPFGTSDSASNFLPPGSPEVEQALQPVVRNVSVNRDFFAALGLPLVRGRAFTAAETADGAAVTVVDEDFVQRYCKDRDPLGLTFKVGVQNQDAMRELTIIGVARTIKQRSLDEHATRPTIYLPLDAPADPMLLVRTSVDPAALAEPLRAALHEAAPRAKLMGIFSMREWIEKTVRDRIRLNTLLELLGAMALVLAAVGLYAVLAFSVRARTSEFGIRMALGASSREVRRSVLLQGARLALAGLLLAMPFAYLLARALDTRLYHVGALDPVSYAGVALLLGGVSLAACWFPAWRAARVDPIEALRCE